MWMLFAAGSAVFAGASAILAKMGLRDTDSSVATALRTVVVLVFSWIMVFVSGSFAGIAELDARTVLFLVLSGLCTGASWLCYFRDLKDGPVSVVVPIDKLSVTVTVLFSAVFLKERLSVKGMLGIVLITAGTLMTVLGA